MNKAKILFFIKFITDNVQLYEAEEGISRQEWTNMSYIVHVFVRHIKLNIEV